MSVCKWSEAIKTLISVTNWRYLGDTVWIFILSGLPFASHMGAPIPECCRLRKAISGDSKRLIKPQAAFSFYISTTFPWIKWYTLNFFTFQIHQVEQLPQIFLHGTNSNLLPHTTRTPWLTYLAYITQYTLNLTPSIVFKIIIFPSNRVRPWSQHVLTKLDPTTWNNKKTDSNSWNLSFPHSSIPITPKCPGRLTISTHRNSSVPIQRQRKRLELILPNTFQFL